MSNYATLLEECIIEESYVNETFESLHSFLEGVTEFVNEDVNFEISVSLDEAFIEEGKATFTAKQVGQAIKNTAIKLKDKLVQFIKNIGEAVKRFIAKAKITIANSGNKAMKAIIDKRGMAKVTKPISLIEIKGGASAVEGILKKGLSAAGSVYSIMNGIKNSADGLSFTIDIEKAFDADATIEAFAKPIDKSELAKTTKPGFKGKEATALYKEYAGDYFEKVSKNLPAIESTVKAAQKACNDVVKILEGINVSSQGIDRESIANLNKCSASTMRITTYCLNYCASILTMAAKNAAKIALGAGAKAMTDKQIAAAEKKENKAKMGETKARLQNKYSFEEE